MGEFKTTEAFLCSALDFTVFRRQVGGVFSKRLQMQNQIHVNL